MADVDDWEEVPLDATADDWEEVPLGPRLPKVSGLEAAAAGAAQVPFAAGDEIGAALQTQWKAMAKVLPDSFLETIGVDPRIKQEPWDPIGTFRQARSENQQIDEAAVKQHPVPYYGTLVGGTLATAGLMPGNVAAKGTGLLPKVMAGLQTGMRQGAAYGLGASKADLTRLEPGEFGEAALDTVKGGSLGGLFGAAGATLGHGFGKAADFFGKKGDEALDAARAIKAAEQAEREASAAGRWRAEIQKGNRIVENIDRLRKRGRPEDVEYLASLEDEGIVQELEERLFRNNVRNLPDQADLIAKRLGELEEEVAKRLGVEQAAQQFSSPTAAMQQAKPAFMRHVLPVLGASVGTAMGGPVGGGVGYLAGRGAQWAMKDAYRLAQHPAARRTAARAAEGLARAGEKAFGRPLAAEAAAFDSVPQLVRSNPELLGAWARYFKPIETEEDEQDARVAAYVLSRTHPAFADHLREIQGLPAEN